MVSWTRREPATFEQVKHPPIPSHEIPSGKLLHNYGIMENHHFQWVNPL